MYIEPGTENACKLEMGAQGPTPGSWHAGDLLQIHANERDEDAIWIDASVFLE
jgi:hypothetical protein